MSPTLQGRVFPFIGYVGSHQTNLKLTFYRQASGTVDYSRIFHPRQWRIVGGGMATWSSFRAESQTKVCPIFIMSPCQSCPTSLQEISLWLLP